MGLVRIRAAAALGGMRLRLTLTDGQVVERDVGPLMVGPVFDGIRRDPEEFSRVAVDAGTVVWPNGADLDPDVLIWGGLPPDERAALPPPQSVGAAVVS
jgi:hypothetical protein